MSYVQIADLIAADVDGALSGRKRRSFAPEPEEAGEGGVPGPTPQPVAPPVSQPSPSVAPQGWAAPAQAPESQSWGPPEQAAAPAPAAPWWGSGASFFFPTSAPPASSSVPAFAPAAVAPDMGELNALTTVEYMRPAAAAAPKEGSFESTPALEAGGDDMADDDGMGGEQMLYEGLTGGEADKVSNPGIADSVDAGGQGPFVDVQTMNSGSWEADDGTGIDVLVEPGQASSQPESQPQVPAAVVPSSAGGPPVFRSAANGQTPSRNGASTNGVHKNGTTPKNRVAERVAAFNDAAPLIQGTGAATQARPRRSRYDQSAPPDPRSFGLGQTPAPSVGVDLAKQMISSAEQVGTAMAISRTPPQFRSPAPTGQDPSLAQSQSSGVMPWVFGAIGVGAVIGGIWWLTTRQKDAPVSRAEPEPQVVANRPRRAVRKSSKTKKSKHGGKKRR